MSKVPPKRILSLKEAALFKELLTLYETRQLKKGLKTADQILKKFPEHGETICMKGLILAHMGKRDEGIDMVKKGVRLDLTSHICWHVFGIVQKSEKNYEEALKSYTQALRFDKENLNILRDAAQLQTQLRYFDGLVETRHTLLKSRPSVRQHWIALAVAYHLNGNIPEARKVLEQYQRMLKNVPDYDIEHSETLLYHICVLEEMGEYSEALSLLDSNAKSRAIVDRAAIMELRARLLSKLGSDEAEDAWRALIEYNSDNYDYYNGYLLNKGIALEPSNPDALDALKQFADQLPKASAPRRLALDIASQDNFRELVKSYLHSGLIKGVPSLFVDIKALYTDDSKRQVVEEIVEAALVEFSPPSKPVAESEPTTYLWSLYFLAQHYTHLGHTKKALDMVELALSHTPTLPELYACKARTLKRAGDLYGAARCLDEARLLDGQDRFLNTKYAKYLLRAECLEEAIAILGLFTKKEAASAGADLEDMQSLLYLIEEADAHHRAGRLNLALKKYVAVQKIFNEVEDDQYDFHSYNLRKFTLNIYMKLVKWEDRLRSHPAYVHIALSASRIYVAVYDEPTLAADAQPSDQVADAEKKAKNKAKKAARKVQEDNKKTPAPSANEDKGIEAPAVKDDDPEGLKLLTVSDPLEQAAKLLKPLITLATENIDAWIVIYDVAIRRRKLLQAVKALHSAYALDAENPELHFRLVHFRQAIEALPQQPPAPVGAVVIQALQKLVPKEVSLQVYNSNYLQRHTDQPLHMLAAARVSQQLQSPIQEAEEIVFQMLREDSKLDVPAALKITSFLNSIHSARLEEFRSACDSRFQFSTVFKSESELKTLRKLVRVKQDESKVDESP